MRNHKQRGFTLIEVMVASTIFTMTIGAAMVAINQDTSAHRVLSAHLGPELRATKGLDFLVTELRMAGVRGEDRDGDGVLDPSEDINENFVFDSNWDLADGTIDQPSLTFNRRVEVRFSSDDVAASGVYSRGITYAVEDGRLIRTARRTDDKGKVVETRTVLARGVSALRFSRTANVITVEVDVFRRLSARDTTVRTLAKSVFLRG